MQHPLTEPQINLSEWTPWQDRARLQPVGHQPTMGVYLWARFSIPPGPSLRAYPELCEEVIYVGETNDLNVRPLGPRRHDGLTKYVEFFPEDPDFTQLYVSV